MNIVSKLCHTGLDLILLTNSVCGLTTCPAILAREKLDNKYFCQKRTLTLHYLIISEADPFTN